MTDYRNTISDRPRFSTKIPARGSEGNIFLILGRAQKLMREIEVDPSDISELVRRVSDSSNYADAVRHIREWFPVVGDDAEDES